MNIDRIITENIRKFLIEETEGLTDASRQVSNKVGSIVKKDVPSATKKQLSKVKKDTKSDTKTVLKQQAKENGWGAALKAKAANYTRINGRKIDDESITSAYDYLNAPTTNLSAVADKLVDMGLLNCKKGPSAQSYLRKMSLELAAPSGGNYELRKSMVNGILKIKSELG